MVSPTTTTTYSVTVTNSSGCSAVASGTVTVTTSATANPDAGTVSAGTGGTPITNVRANDIVNGVAATSANSSLSLVSSTAGITLNTSTGSVSVAQGTTPGSYTLVYQLCTTQGSPTTCTTPLLDHRYGQHHGRPRRGYGQCRYGWGGRSRCTG